MSTRCASSNWRAQPAASRTGSAAAAPEKAQAAPSRAAVRATGIGFRDTDIESSVGVGNGSGNDTVAGGPVGEPISSNWTRPSPGRTITGMDLHVSLVGRHDLTGEIYRQLRGLILDGRLREGDRLPPSRELAQGLSVSRTTVSVAYDRLLSEGYVTSRAGAGTFVNGHCETRRATSKGSAGVLRARALWDEVNLP